MDLDAKLDDLLTPGDDLTPGDVLDRTIAVAALLAAALNQAVVLAASARGTPSRLRWETDHTLMELADVADTFQGAVKTLQRFHAGATEN